MSEQVPITIERYNELLGAELKLQCLEAAGVDNWEGYDYAMEQYYKEEGD